MDPTATLVVMLAAVFSLSGVIMRTASALSASNFARRHRARVDKTNTRISRAAHLRLVVANSVVSSGMVVGVTVALRHWLFLPGPVGVLRTLGEAAAILAIYDFGYYLLHRFGFHGWAFGRKVHAVHHSIRTPYAVDSLYVHPLETAAGVGLFLGAVAIVGPVALWSFAIAFFLYSVLNVWIHSAVDIRKFPLRALSALVRHHDVHHESMKSGYYASLTPLWDVVFGTARRPPAPAKDEPRSSVSVA